MDSSYLKYDLPSGSPVVTDLAVDIIFLSERSDGLVLYGQQSSGQGDFFSLALKNGTLFFDFDLGEYSLTFVLIMVYWLIYLVQKAQIHTYM